MPRGAMVLFLGAILLLVGVIVSDAGAAAGVGLVVLGAVVLAVFFVYAGIQNLRTPGWTRAYNPGAAYREAKAEREARAAREALAAHAADAEEFDEDKAES